MAYPDLPLHVNSSRTAVNGSLTDLSDDGTVWVRNFFSHIVYEFNLLHNGITQAQADSLMSFYDTNKDNGFSLAYKKDNTTYSVYFVAPPSVDKTKNFDWWDAQVLLRGTTA